MTRTGNGAIAWGRAHMRWPQGYCQQWVRMCFDVASRDPSAAEAWARAQRKHRTENGNHCPRAVPVFWTGGSQGYGHVALSVGNGMCLSTDAAGPGVCAKVSINGLTSRWGLNFQGWTEDINGVRVYNARLGKPAEGWERVRLSAVRPGETNNDVWVVKRKLLQKLGPKLAHITVEGDGRDHFGDGTRAAVRVFQHRIGFSGSAADGIPGETTIRKLGLTPVD